MNFQLRRFIHSARQYLTFEVFMMIVMLLTLAYLNAVGLYCAYVKIERRSRGAAAGLTPAPADAEPEAPRK